MRNLKLIIPTIFITQIFTTASAQDYQSWPRLDAGSVYWYIDESTASKVANTIFFDGYINRFPNSPIFESAARTGIKCDGSAYFLISSPWNIDTPRKTSELAASLDLRRSIEMDQNFIKIERTSLSSAFRTKLSNLCRTNKRPGKNFLAVIATNSKGDRTLARLNTFIQTERGQIDIWIDNVKSQKFQPMELRNSEWKPAVNEDGTPSYSLELAPNRTSTTKIRYDCEQRKYVALSVVEYSTEGSVTSSHNFSPANISKLWSEAIPDTVGESELEFLCSL